MRILHTIDMLSSVGGAQNYVRALLAAQVARGHAVGVVAGDGAPASEGVTSASLHDPALPAWIAAFDPDIVHLHDFGLPLALERELGAARALVRSLHNFSFTCATGTRWYGDGEICTRPHGPGCLISTITRGCAHRLDLRPVLTGYRRVGEQLPRIRSTPLTILHSAYVGSLAALNGVPVERCRVVPYFVELPQEVAPHPQERIVCFAGRIVANKGLDLLLEALGLRPDTWDELLVAGDGWARPRCAALAERLGIAERVRFLGWTSREDALRAIRRSRVLALPSRWPEPFGISGLEASAESRPVVATRVGGIPEWLVDGETGVLVPPGDAEALAEALAHVLGDDAFARRLGDEGRRRAARFGADAHLAALERVYGEVPPVRSAAAFAGGHA